MWDICNKVRARAQGSNTSADSYSIHVLSLSTEIYPFLEIAQLYVNQS